MTTPSTHLVMFIMQYNQPPYIMVVVGNVVLVKFGKNKVHTLISFFKRLPNKDILIFEY